MTRSDVHMGLLLHLAQQAQEPDAPQCGYFETGAGSGVTPCS